jgi:hypothetical protein
MDPVIFTNGLLLNDKSLSDLKGKGLSGVVIRVDSLRINRKKTERELNKQRYHFADLVKRIGGISLAFTCVIDHANLLEVPDVIHWAQENHDKVNILVLILKRHIVFNLDEGYEEDLLNVSDLIEAINKRLPGLKFSSYLGSDKEDLGIKWMQSYWIAMNKKVLWYLNKHFIEFVQTFHHFRKGTYTYIMRRGDYSVNLFKILGLSLFLKEFRYKVLPAYLRDLVKGLFSKNVKASVQLINIVCPPDFVEGERDLCDACPDAILYKGKLYPSCILEEVVRFGRFVKKSDLMNEPVAAPQA